MKERIIGFFACLFIIGQLKLLAQNGNVIKLTLKQCVEAAINNNLLVKQGDLDMKTGQVNLYLF